MLLGILTLITALSISAVAIYYSVAGLVAIFAAAAVPIMIMGGVLEVSKLVTAVWLHRYWSQATWWLRTYLSTAVFVLMLITSMGIFGFLSKAHIEQTSASEESIARVETITTEINRQQGIIERAENRISQLESSESSADSNIQSQIDKEQERIDKAFERIQPAIAQQNQIITDARASDNTRTKPYEDQLASIQAEILRLETSAKEYEDSISGLSVDSTAVEPLLAQIAAIEEEIIRVTNQLNSNETQQVRAGQAIIGVTSDGLFGGNTRTALANWVSSQRERITQIQGEVAQVRRDATTTVDSERDRLAGVVKDIRERQIPALKERELTMLGKIDEVRQTESPAIQTARDEIQRLRESAESQVAQSQALIQRLQQQLANTDNSQEIQTAIDEQNERVRSASFEIDRLTEERITLEAEYRKLEAEVGPIKYIAEFIYGDTADKNMLEEAVRWVIITIIFVFDPLAVLLLIASQYTFEWRHRKDDNGGWLRQYEQARAQRIVDNPGFDIGDSAPPTQEEKVDEVTAEKEGSGDTTETVDRDGLTPGTYTGDSQRVSVEQDQDPQQDEKEIENDLSMEETNTDADATVRDMVSEDDVSTDDEAESRVEQVEVQSDGLSREEIVELYSSQPQKKSIESSEEYDPVLAEQRSIELDELEQLPEWSKAKRLWKADHPDLNLKQYKLDYIRGKIDELPWQSIAQDLVTEKQSYIIKDDDGHQTYVQNSEQNENSIWNRIKRNSDN